MFKVPGTGLPILPGAGATVHVYARDTTTHATIYSAATGATTLSQPLTADSLGSVPGYVDEGSYDLALSGTGITARTYRWEAIHADSLTALGSGSAFALKANLPINVMEHGIVPNDSSAGAIAANDTAIATIMGLAPDITIGSDAVRGAEFAWPRSRIYVSQGLKLAGHYGFKFTGEGGRGPTNGAASTLVYTGTSGSLIDGRGGYGFEASGMRFEYTSTSYTGDLLNFDWYGTCRLTSSYTAGSATMNLDDTSTLTSSGTIRLQTLTGFAYTDVTYTGKTSTTLTGCSGGSGTFVVAGTLAIQSATGGDVAYIHIHDCLIGGNAATGATLARSLIRFNHTIISHVSDTGFIRADTGILLGDPNYAIAMQIDENCTFNLCTRADVRSAGGVEALKLSANTYEPRTDQSAGAFEGDASVPVLGFAFDDNWGGDVSLGGNSWVKGCFYGFHYSGNRMAAVSPNTTTTSSISSGATTIPLASATGFPTSGTGVVAVFPAVSPPIGQSFTYTGISGSTLTGVSGITQTFASGSAVATGAHIELLGNSKGIHVDGSYWEPAAFGILMQGQVSGLALIGINTGNALLPLGGPSPIPTPAGIFGASGLPNTVYGTTYYEDVASGQGKGFILGIFEAALKANDLHAQMGMTHNVTGFSDHTFVIMPGNDTAAGGTREINLVSGGGNRKIRVADAGVGFNDTAPTGKRTLGAAATDAGTTQTLANNLRQALIDLGLGQT